jgi:hypothetical protein
MRPEEQQLAFERIAQIKKMLADKKNPPAPPPSDHEPF